MRKTQLLSLLAIVPLALSLSACEENKSEVVEQTESPAATEATPSEEPAKPEVKRPAFGETVEYKDGLRLTVAEPAEFTPGEWSIGGDGEGTPLKFEITIENGSEEDFNPALFHVSVLSGGKESEQIFDSAALGEQPDTTLIPGKSVTWSEAFMVADPDDLVMDVNIMDSFTRAKTTYVK